MRETPYRFWYFFNSAKSKSIGMPQYTLHYRGKKHDLHKMIIESVVWTSERKTYPYYIFKGLVKEKNMQFFKYNGGLKGVRICKDR
ncbi:MAG: hypothetical protein GOVbin4296_27 [Prokaryotic dsDNA virus sp.]|nr:MAG: hypothetical protein GOVbin4296_27 [Prokaryotic dsDNA virus sp.]|tara:strand:+ start:688 stop:945 length:258 start_codon:yes stop_codon:yes gene_type:complete